MRFIYIADKGKVVVIKMQLPIKVELNFDEEFINLLKELKPKRGGIYAKVYKELLNDIIAAYYHTRKGMEQNRW